MPKQPTEVEATPTAPSPSSDSPTDGMEDGRTLARRYLPDLVRLYAGIALGQDTEASLHTRFLAANALAGIAGAIPQATPTAPSFDGPSNGTGSA